MRWQNRQRRNRGAGALSAPRWRDLVRTRGVLLVLVVELLIAAMVVFTIAGPWMLSTLVDFIRRSILSIPSMIG